MTRETLLRTTVRLISEGGEAKVRLADVAEQSGLSIGAIQHHFSSREELVAAAQVERLLGNTESDITAIASLLGSSNSVADVIRGLQDRGYLRPELDPAAVAVFIQAYALGMVVADLQEPAVDAESLAVVIDRFMDSVLMPDG
jgi:AcrR family transcriptional regulator